MALHDKKQRIRSLPAQGFLQSCCSGDRGRPFTCARQATFLKFIDETCPEGLGRKENFDLVELVSSKVMKGTVRSFF